MKRLIFNLGLITCINYAVAQTNTFPATGSVGIGTTTPAAGIKLDVIGAISAVGGESRFSNTTYTDPISGFAYGIKVGGGGIAIKGTSYFVDNIGIGTHDTKGYRLAVVGGIIAESVRVKMQAQWPDYVFSKAYVLPPLAEIEAHIKAKGHLPGIPSAAEVMKNGIDLGEMNKNLLQKIEELTLHLIEQEKRIDKQDEELAEQSRKIKVLTSKIK